jgi:hypothetical protein
MNQEAIFKVTSGLSAFITQHSSEMSAYEWRGGDAAWRSLETVTLNLPPTLDRPG